MIDYKDPKAVMEVYNRATLGPCTVSCGSKQRNASEDLQYLEPQYATSNYFDMTNMCRYWIAKAERLRPIVDLLLEKERICTEWKNGSTFSPTKQDFVAEIYRLKDIDRQIGELLAGLEGGGINGK